MTHLKQIACRVDAEIFGTRITQMKRIDTDFFNELKK